jgi:hypothetical protein
MSVENSVVIPIDKKDITDPLNSKRMTLTRLNSLGVAGLSKPDTQSESKENTNELENKQKDTKENTNDKKEKSDKEEDPLSILPNAQFLYQEVDQMLKEAYNYKESNSSMICDIISMYLKGQKILYTEAKTLCEQRLNYLMLPTICITAVCAVISIALKEYPYGTTIVSSLSALNFFFLNLINYLKLDAKAEAHRVSAYKFDKLQSKLEFNSGKILFVVGASKELPKLIMDTEKDVSEIKETNQFILPENIRYKFPKLNNINVFAEVKKIQSIESLYVNRLKDILNEHVNLNLKIHTTEPDKKDMERRTMLENTIKTITSDIIRIKDQYLDIDKQFENELTEHRQWIANNYGLCSFLKT